MHSPSAFRPNFPAALLVSALIFLVLALRQDVLYLVGAFLCWGGMGLKDLRQRAVFLAICVVFALLVAGYGLGKQLALRDARLCTASSAVA
jgi:hypothetical protein